MVFLSLPFEIFKVMSSVGPKSYLSRVCLASLHVSGKLRTYHSPKPTFCPEREVSVNVGLGEG